MKREQGFSLIELLIVVAIIAIIAAIAVPSMLSARMAANESSAIQGCRTVGSAEIAYSAVNNQNYCALAALQAGGFVDSRFTGGNGFNGYHYLDAAVNGAAVAPGGFGVTATPNAADSTGRYVYGINADEIVRFVSVAGAAPAPMCGAAACGANDPIGKN